MIDWSILPKKFGKQEGANRFELLALIYVRDVYRQYTWVPTGGSHDDNKDAHLGKDVEFDVWEEAKFKSDSYALRRQDLDPTILSGLIQGNVRLIIFVSNARLPEQLLSRSVIGARIRGIEVSCVLGKQLESWLLRHPEHYSSIFEEKLPPYDENDHIVEIQEATFYDMFSTDFNPFNTRTEMLVGEEYLLSISIYSSHSGKARVVTDENMPFILVHHPNCDDPDNMVLCEGLCVFSFLMHADKPFAGGISIRLDINSASYFRVTNEVIIQQSAEVKITYSQQLEIIEKIKGVIGFQPASPSQYIITIFADSGMGKSFVLKSIYTDYVLKRDMTIVGFESYEQNNINNLFLCRIILFLNYGNIFWGDRIKTRGDIEGFKSAALSNNTSSLFSNVLLGDLIDGCFDTNRAVTVIDELLKQVKRTRYSLIKGSGAKLGRILLLDDFQYLSKKQAELIHILCGQLEVSGKNCIIIISATKGKFRDKETEQFFYTLTPNTLTLLGLGDGDKASTLSRYFRLPVHTAEAVSKQLLPNSPLLTREIIQCIQSKHPTPGEIMEVLSAHIAQTRSNIILQNRFTGLEAQFYLLDIIYRFKRGIDISFLYKYDQFEMLKVKSDISILIGRGLIKKNEHILVPYHDYYILSYKQMRKKKFFNREIGHYLNYLLHLPNCTGYFDESQLLSQLIRCGRSYYRSFEGKIKEQILLNVHATNFSVALYYCEYYYEMLEQKKHAAYSSEESYYLYIYADCLVHCGKNGLAEQMLEMVYKLSVPDSIENVEAGASLLNQRFWSMKLDSIVEDSYIIQMNVERLLQKGLTGEELHRMQKAQSSCYNRRMVTLLLMDRYQEARKTYRAWLTKIAEKSLDDAFRSNAATLIMDYARGISYVSPQEALRLMRIALRFFKCNEQEHMRRIMLCRIDIIVLQSITDNNFDRMSLRPLTGDLLKAQFYSESFKSLLKYYACKIIETSEYLDKISDIKTGSSGNRILDEAVKEIYSHLLKIGMTPIAREKFLFENLMAYIHISNGNVQEAAVLLDSVRAFIAPAGGSYCLIAEHNRNNVKNIRKIVWCTKDTPRNPDTFLLDSRYW